MDEFLARETLANGVHSIDCGLPIDFYLKRGRNDTLVVIFGGAITTRDKTQPPYFSGLRVTDGLGCSVLCFNDPCVYLSDSIRIGWYIGTRAVPMQPIMTTIIDTIARRLSCRVVFVGGSAGGFAGLYAVSATSAEALAIVVNPQTNVMRYAPPFVAEFASTSFGCSPAELPPRAVPSVLDLCEHYAGLPKKPPVLYLQNATDWHVKSHAAPFLKSYGIQSAGEDTAAAELYYHSGTWGEGHASIPGTMIAGLLGATVAWKGALADFVADPQVILSALYPVHT